MRQPNPTTKLFPYTTLFRSALRTQQIIAEETGVANTVDPLGGSYFLEALTNKMEEGSLDYFQRIDRMGGMVEAVEKGFPQDRKSTRLNSSHRCSSYAVFCLK